MKKTLFRVSLLTSALLVGFTAYLQFQPAKPARTPLFAMPQVQAQSGCSATTIQANYGYAGEGTLNAGGTKTQIAELGNIEFQAGGTIRGNYTFAMAGAANITGTFTGTYEVGSDCTGNATIDAGGEKSLMNFVIGNRGNTFSYASTGTGGGGGFTMSGLGGRTQ
ncbi:MAG: hypothetical protein JNK87_28390 [Bryobacterales bacterium]|nr:hypothetical protein [Bryobacterales bacterium]